MQEILLKIRYFESGLLKSIKNVTVFFLSNPVDLVDKIIKNKRGLELVTSSFSGYKTSSENFPLLVMYYLTKFDDVI